MLEFERTTKVLSSSKKDKKVKFLWYIFNHFGARQYKTPSTFFVLKNILNVLPSSISICVSQKKKNEDLKWNEGE